MQSVSNMSRLAALFLCMTLGSAVQVSACGLEPGIRGGFTVSHPGSLDVAVAVAKARRDGLLPQANSTAVSNDVQLRRMIGDLQRMQSHLDADGPRDDQNPRASFSLVLIGPGLWSHFHITPGGVLARYHVKGPLEGRTVVLTHHAVIQALLSGDLPKDKAEALGLITYAGGDTSLVRRLFDLGVAPAT